MSRRSEKAKPKNTGKPYEKLVHEYYAHISHMLRDRALVKLDEDVPGPDGSRQCDITIRENCADGSVKKTLIECKNYNTQRVPIGHIDALASKLADIGFDHGIMVTSMGFQDGAQRKAQRIGIGLRLFSESKITKHELDMSRLVLHLEMEFEELAVTFNATPDFRLPIKQFTRDLFGPGGISQMVYEHLRPDVKQLSGIGVKHIVPTDPIWTETVYERHASWFEMIDHQIIDIALFARYQTRVSVGKLQDIQPFYVTKLNGEQGYEAFLTKDIIGDLRKRLRLYSEAGELPRYIVDGDLSTALTYYSLRGERVFERRGIFPLSDSLEIFQSRFPGAAVPKGRWLAAYGDKSIIGESEIGSQSPVSVT